MAPMIGDVMAVQELTTANFESVVGDGIALVDFWATWCGPCRKFSPIFDSVAEKYDDIAFGKVDVDAEPALAAQFGVQSIPTLLVVRDGVILYQQPGVVPATAIESLIEQARELDMTRVREEVGAK
jgi:thioredoxin 1